MAEYTVRICKTILGDVIPLVYVSEAMATHAASGYGTLSLHDPTFENLRPRLVSLLVDAAKKGLLKVCDCNGHVAPAQEIFEANQAPDSMPQIDDLDHRYILSLFVKAKSLTAWGEENGDVFRFVDVPVTAVEFDLKDENGRIVKAGYFRGFVGQGSQAEVSVIEASQGRDIDANATETEDDELSLHAGETSLKEGKNSRAAVEKWVAHQARNMAKAGDNVSILAERIRLLAERFGYESERRKMTTENITKMIPAGLTGGRAKNSYKKKISAN